MTGSRLSNPNLEQAAPIMAVSAKEIALTGQVNVENILKDLPQILPGSTAASNNPGGASPRPTCAAWAPRAPWSW